MCKNFLVISNGEEAEIEVPGYPGPGDIDSKDYDSNGTND